MTLDEGTLSQQNRLCHGITQLYNSASWMIRYLAD